LLTFPVGSNKEVHPLKVKKSRKREEMKRLGFVFIAVLTAFILTGCPGMSLYMRINRIIMP